MINKENEVILSTGPESGPVDIVNLDIQCHLLIKDVDTNEIIVNKRG
jgi:hypothetical protein